MGHESTVYGIILGESDGPPEWERLPQLNRQVIESLPTEDEWPFLTRPMFAIAGPSVREGCYRSQPIHFGATFKSLEWEWHEWLPKFEALLARLFWYDSYLHLRTELVGAFDYHYEADPERAMARFRQRQPVNHWHFRGGPRRFPLEGPVSAEEAARLWTYDDGVWHFEPGCPTDPPRESTHEP